MTAQAVPGMPEEPLPDELKLAIRSHPGIWFDTHGFLEDREKTLRRADPANAIQRELFKIYCWCQDNNEQCNVLGLKSRKEGLSTGATALAYHHLTEHTAEGVIIGTDHETSDTLVNMLRRFAERDTFDWGTSFRYRTSVHEGTWSHGSKISRETAKESTAKRGSTLQVLVATEVAHWPHDGKRSADDTMLSLLNSMPDVSNILRVVDSTAAGATGWFYDTYQGAVTFEDRKAGKRGNGWVRLFEPWHASDLRRVKLTDEQRAVVRQDLSQREQAGIALYGWSEEQIQWRRDTIATKCSGDEKKFDQEYPESEDVAFLTSGSPKFHVANTARMLRAAENGWRSMRAGQPGGGYLGYLRGNPLVATDMPHMLAIPDGAWLWVREDPKRGRKYLLFGDPMTGEQSAGATVRDRHAFGVIRDAYADEEGTHVPEVVACLHDEEGARWDMDVLADRVALLHRWYGKCLVVPEVNKAMDLIPLLRQRHVTNLYHRPVRPDHDNPAERQEAVGFYTSEQTRGLWVTALTEAIRQQSFVCMYPPAIRDFMTFIINKKGKAEAAPRKFDDWVAGIALGILTLPSATLYAEIKAKATPRPLVSGNGQPGLNRFGACG